MLKVKNTKQFDPRYSRTIHFLIVYYHREDDNFYNSAHLLQKLYSNYKKQNNIRLMNVADFFSFLESESSLEYIKCDLFVFHYIGHSNGSYENFPVLGEFKFIDFINALEKVNNYCLFIDCCNQAYYENNNEIDGTLAGCFFDYIEGKHVILAAKPNHVSYFNRNTMVTYFTKVFIENISFNFEEMLIEMETKLIIYNKVKNRNTDNGILYYQKNNEEIKLNHNEINDSIIQEEKMKWNMNTMFGNIFNDIKPILNTLANKLENEENANNKSKNNKQKNSKKKNKKNKSKN